MLKKFISDRIKSSRPLGAIISGIYNIPVKFSLFRAACENSFNLESCFLKKTQVRIQGKGNQLSIGDGTILIDCKISIAGNDCRVVVSENCSLKNLEICIEDDRGEIHIGKETTIEGAHLASTEGQKISIGTNCMFADNIEIRNGDSHAIFDSVTRQRINHAKSVIIKDNVWIGAGSKVLKGSVIESGAIISAGAIVTGEVEGQCIYAGIPARKKKDHIFWTRERS